MKLQLTAAILGVPLALGCGVQGDNDATSIGSKEAEIVVAGQRLWPQMPLDVCFTRIFQGTAADRANFSSIIDETWGSIPGSNISINWHNSCVNGVDYDVRINFLNTLSDNGSSVPGTDNAIFNDLSTQVMVGVPTGVYGTGVATKAMSADRARYQYIHEFGHVLGFLHEHTHLEVNGNSSGAAEDCFVYFLQEQGQNGEALTERSGNPDSVDLADYDTQSIMNYCASVNGSDYDVDLVLATLQLQLSDRDKLFAQLIYPAPDISLGIACESNCFKGDKVYLRTDGSVNDEPTSRGAYPWWRKSVVADRLTWTRGGNNIGSNTATVKAIALQPGEQTIKYRGVVDFANVTFLSTRVIKGEGAVVVDDAKWTSIAMSAL